MYFRDDEYYRYKGSRTQDKLEEFVFSLGYLSSKDQGPIPHKLANFKKKHPYHKIKKIKDEMYKSDLPQEPGSIGKFAMAIDSLFEEHVKAHKFIPSWFRYIVAMVILSCPLWSMAICSWFGHMDSKFHDWAEKTQKQRLR